MGPAAHDATMYSPVDGVNLPERKPVQVERHFASVPPIEMVRDRMVRDFERGVCLASLGVIYRTRSKVIQGVLRSRLRELEAQMRAVRGAA